MGFFNRLVRDLVNDVTNAVERNASEKIINPAIDKVADNAKNKVLQQVEQAQEAVFSAPPTIALDKENYNIMVIASKDRLYFMDKVLGASPKKVMLKLIGTLRFSAENCGSFAGNSEVANRLYNVILETTQKIFDEYAAKNMTMAAALENPKFLGAMVVKQNKQIWDEYGIENPQLIITSALPFGGDSVNAAAPQAPVQPASWTCQYCGSSNTTDFCVSCGAPKG